MGNIFLGLAQKASNEKKWNQAIVLWRVVDIFSDIYKVDAEIKISQALIGRGEKQKALKRIIAATKKHPNDMRLMAEAGSIAYDLQEYETAKEFMLLQMKSSSLTANQWLKLSKIYGKLGDNTTCLETLTEGLKFFADDRKLLIEYISCALRTDSINKILVSGKIEKLYKFHLGNLSAIEQAKLIRASRLCNELKMAENIIKKIKAENRLSPEMVLEQAELFTQQQDWTKAYERWEYLKTIVTEDKKYESINARATYQSAVIKTILNIDEFKLRIKDYKARKQKAKVAIVTCYTKGYDLLKPPLYIDNLYDYYVFTNDKPSSMGIYNVRELPLTEYDDARNIRYVKTNPQKILDGYETIVWIDANVVINGSIRDMIEDFKKSGRPIGSIQHPLRNNVYEEAQACIELGKGDPEVIEAQMDTYRRERFISKGHYENSFLFFNVGHPKLESILGVWWDQIKKFSTRDQLSFMYANQKYKESPYVISKRPVNMRNHPKLVFTGHGVGDLATEKLRSLLNMPEDSKV